MSLAPGLIFQCYKGITPYEEGSCPTRFGLTSRVTMDTILSNTNENITVAFSGFIRIFSSGSYNFSLGLGSSPGGVAWSLDVSAKQVVVMNDFVDQTSTMSGSVTLEGGLHSLKLVIRSYKNAQSNPPALSLLVAAESYWPLSYLGLGDYTRQEVAPSVLFYSPEEYATLSELFHVESERQKEADYENKISALEEAIETNIALHEAQLEALDRNLSKETEKNHFLLRLMGNYHTGNIGNRSSRASFDRRTFSMASDATSRSSRVSSMASDRPPSLVSSSASAEESFLESKISSLLSGKEMKVLEGYLDEMDRLKRLYFFTASLAIKSDRFMNDSPMKHAVQDAPKDRATTTASNWQRDKSPSVIKRWSTWFQIRYANSASKPQDLHALYDQVVEENIPIEDWPLLIEKLLTVTLK